MNNFALPHSRFAAASSWVTLSTSGTAHTKGSWTQLIASTSKNANRIIVSAGFGSVFRDGLVDFGIGGSGSEQVMIANVPTSELSDENIPSFDFPMTIPAGTRISARQQASGTTGVFVATANPYWTPAQRGAHLITTYGADTSNTRGTQVDPGGTGNAKGSWTQITSSTSANHTVWWVATPGFRAGRVTSKFLLDIGVGGSGSEQVIFPDLPMFVYFGTDFFQPNNFGPFYMPVPAGTRISARGLNSVNGSSPDRIIDVILFGA